MEEEIDFIDAEEYVGKGKGMSYKEIVLRHLGKISQICTKEFKEGYWQKKPIATSGGGMFMTEVYHEDTRDAYINAVDYFHDILLPFFDESMKKKDKEILDRLGDERRKITDAGGGRDEWIDEKLDIKRALFQELLLLIQRAGFLEQQVIEDG